MQAASHSAGVPVFPRESLTHSADAHSEALRARRPPVTRAGGGRDLAAPFASPANAGFHRTCRMRAGGRVLPGTLTFATGCRASVSADVCGKHMFVIGMRQETTVLV